MGSLKAWLIRRTQEGKEEQLQSLSRSSPLAQPSVCVCHVVSIKGNSSAQITGPDVGAPDATVFG